MSLSKDPKTQFFEELIEPMRRTMVTFAYSHTGNQSDAEDIVQETCGVAWEKIDVLMKSPNPKGWMMNAVKLHILKHAARRAKDRRIEEALEIDEEASAIRIDDSDERSIEKILSPDELTIVQLRGKGFKHSEIADKLGITHGAARTRLSRIKEKVENFLKGLKDVENF